METAFNITAEGMEDYRRELISQERSPGTIRQYLQAVGNLFESLPEDKEVTRERLLDWKTTLAAQRAAGTVNSMIAAVNTFLDLMGTPQLKLKTLKRQRRICDGEELTEDDVQALLDETKRDGDEQMELLLLAMSDTGVRVSEVKFLTVEAARLGMAVVSLKGKTRQVPLGAELCRRLLRFAKANRIASGPVFVNRKGKPLDRRRIWERMKKLCAGAGVDPKKVHPHAFRHLFARLFYGVTKDISGLADLLGHSSIDTTRIYISTPFREHRAILDQLAGVLGAKKKPPRRGGGKRTKY